jgi:hypothetical protein
MFAQKSRSAPKCAFTKILEFLQFQKERVESGEISPATLRNFVKAINLFSEMSDIFFCILFIVVCLFVYQYAAALPPLFVLVAGAALLPLLVTGEFAPAVTTDELWLCLFFWSMLCVLLVCAFAWSTTNTLATIAAANTTANTANEDCFLLIFDMVIVISTI